MEHDKKQPEDILCTVPSSCAHGPTPHEHVKKNNRLLTLSQWLFIATAIGMALFLREAPFFVTLSITFVSIFLEALPFILLGSLIGGLIEVFVSKHWISDLFDRVRFIAVFIAGGLGFIFPVCECAIVPIVRRLIQKGLPLGAAVTFLLAGPIVNPLVATSTAMAYGFDWSMAMDRVIHGYLIAVTIGIFMELMFRPDQAIQAGILSQEGKGSLSCHDTHCSCHTHLHQEKSLTFSQKMHASLYHAMDDFMDIGRFLVIGAFFAGLFQAVISRGAIAEMVTTPTLSVFIMMVLSFLLNLCSEADAFVAASFRSVSMPISAQLAFLLIGPMLDIKLLLMYTRVFKKRALMVLCGSIFILIFVSMLIKGAA